MESEETRRSIVFLCKFLINGLVQKKEEQFKTFISLLRCNHRFLLIFLFNASFQLSVIALAPHIYVQDKYTHAHIRHPQEEETRIRAKVFPIKRLVLDINTLLLWNVDAYNFPTRYRKRIGRLTSIRMILHFLNLFTSIFYTSSENQA